MEYVLIKCKKKLRTRVNIRKNQFVALFSLLRQISVKHLHLNRFHFRRRRTFIHSSRLSVFKKKVFLFFLFEKSRAIQSRQVYLLETSHRTLRDFFWKGIVLAGWESVVEGKRKDCWSVGEWELLALCCWVAGSWQLVACGSNCSFPSAYVTRTSITRYQSSTQHRSYNQQR
jgi:hypothetical protein